MFGWKKVENYKEKSMTLNTGKKGVIFQKMFKAQLAPNVQTSSI